MEGNYDYYQLYLTAPHLEVQINMLTTSNSEPDHYPVTVYDVNGNEVGTAQSKSDFILIWNQANTDIGKLTGGYGPFAFVLNMSPGSDIPNSILGNPIHVFSGIFSNTFGSEFN